jgi:hypothetical protein
VTRGRIKVNFQPAEDCWYCAVGRHRECSKDRTQVRDDVLGKEKHCGCWVRNGRPKGRHKARVIDEGDAILNILGALGGGND